MIKPPTRDNLETSFTANSSISSSAKFKSFSNQSSSLSNFSPCHLLVQAIRHTDPSKLIFSNQLLNPKKPVDSRTFFSSTTLSSKLASSSIYFFASLAVKENFPNSSHYGSTIFSTKQNKVSPHSPDISQAPLKLVRHQSNPLREKSLNFNQPNFSQCQSITNSAKKEEEENENAKNQSLMITNQPVEKFHLSKQFKKNIKIAKSLEAKKKSSNTTLKKKLLNSKDDLHSVKDLVNADLLAIESSKSDRYESAESKFSRLKQVKSPSSDEFQVNLKHLEKINDFQEFYGQKPNIYSALNNSSQQKNLLPRKLQLIQENQQNIKANQLFGSAKYLEVFSQGVASGTYSALKTLQIKKSSLNLHGLKELLEKLPQSLQVLDLASNKIDPAGALQIQKYLRLKSTSLQVLNLESNNLGNSGSVRLFEALDGYRFLKCLNLSKNQISETEMIGKILKTSASVQELYLHYNRITSAGGCKIFEGLYRNQYLKVLDVSFNQLGMKQGSECASKIAEVLGKPHPELVHLDLSYNEFKENEAKSISEQLAFNQILYGIHFEGNAKGWSVNSRGYLTNQKEMNVSRKKQQQVHRDHYDTGNDSFTTEIEDELAELQNKIAKFEQSESQGSKFFRRIDSVLTLRPRKDVSLSQSDCCWVCDGWWEVKFVWMPRKSGPIEQEPVFLHLDFEQYRPVVMNREDDYFCLYHMCPPNSQIKYFFSNPLEAVQLFAKDQRTVCLDEFASLRKDGVALVYSDGTYMHSQKMSIVNQVVTKQAQVLDPDRHYIPSVYSKPRQPEVIYQIDPQLAEIRNWSIEKSFFRDYRPDSEDYLAQCLEQDLLNSHKFLKHFDHNAIRQKLTPIYKHVLACYKYYASATLNYDFPCVDQTAFHEFISTTNLTVKKVSLDLSYLAAYVQPKDTELCYVKEKCLVRHQFLETLLRLSLETYLKKDLCKTLSECVDQFFTSEQVYNWQQKFGVSQEWRDLRYWNQSMDLTIKLKMPILKLLYDFTSKLSHKRHAGSKYVTARDFHSFFDCAGLRSIDEQELYLIFQQSMMTQVDELTTPRHFLMNFLEFIEALARVAEKLSPSSPSYKIKCLSIKKRRVLPLFVKFEGLLFLLYHALKTHFAKEYDPEEKILQIDQKIVTQSFLQSTDAKKLGIFECDSSDEDDDGVDNLSVRSNLSKFGVEQLMKELLFDEEKVLDFGEKRTPNLRRNSTFDRFMIQKQAEQASKQTKPHSKRRESTLQIQTFYSSNIAKKIQQEQEEVEIIEQAELEESSPLTKFSLQKQRQLRRRYSQIKSIKQTTFNFEDDR